MAALPGWHLVVLALMTVVPVVVVGVLVAVAVRLRRAGRSRSEERIAQRTAELLRSSNRRDR